MTRVWKRWTEDEIECLREGCALNMTAKEIAEALGRSVDTVKSKKIKLGLSGSTTRRGGTQKGTQRRYSDEDLLNIIRNMDSPSFDAVNKGGNGLPAGTTFVKRFGSWNRAMELAGIDPKVGTQVENKATIVYLVYFPGEDLYKIGITQQGSVNRRLHGYPEYETILTLSCSMLSEAKQIEKTWLNNV